VNADNLQACAAQLHPGTASGCMLPCAMQQDISLDVSREAKKDLMLRVVQLLREAKKTQVQLPEVLPEVRSFPTEQGTVM
jgi:hypothetical protein